jgi:STE24 endopeptidase
MTLFTQVFLAALAIGTLLQLWLLRRHLRHVAAHRNRVPAEFADQIELQDHQKAADYTQAKGGLARLEIIFGSLILLLWTLGGGLELVNRFWLELSLNPLVGGIAIIMSVFFISSLLDLPFAVWRTFKIETTYGFNRTSIGQFIKDRLLGALLGVLLGVPLLGAILWLMDSAGNYWWLAAWVVWMSFTLFLTWAYPRIIAPLFNRFTPLEEGEMLQRIQALLQRCGFTSDGIFVMDGSKRSSHGNAYFTGFGNNKRIVFFDTLLNSLTPSEMEAVLAHELGHFRYRHIIKHMLVMAALSLGCLALLGWLSQQPWFYHDLGISQPSNAVALMLFMLAAPVFTLFFAPIGSYLSRRHEFEADAYAATHADGNQLIEALVKLYQDNASTLTPDPLYSMFHDSHPPAPVRIAHISEKCRG